MKRRYIFAAVGIFLIPILLRGLWFYRGWYRAPSTLSTPDYESFRLPIPPTNSEPRSEEAVDPDGRVVLFDYSHNNQFNFAELDPFLEDLNLRGARAEIVQDTYDPGELPLYERLKYASAYVVIAPQASFSPTTVELIERFVDRGGRLLVISDPTRNLYDYYYEYFSESYISEAFMADSLLAPFDISYANDFLYNLIENEGNFRHVFFHQFAEDELTDNLSELVFYGARSIQTNSGTALITGDEQTRSSQTSADADLAVAVRSLDGSVVAIGDFTFLTAPYNQVADNQIFIDHLIDFLLGGERSADLADYPYIFGQSVALLKSSEFDLTSENLEMITSIQNTFSARGQNLVFTDEPEPDSDLIVLTTYDSESEYFEALKSIDDLMLPFDFFDSLSVPHFGEIASEGIGLVILVKEEDRTLLFLLAATVDDVLELASILETDEISNCLVLENVGICKAGTAMDYDFGFDDYDYDYDYDFDFDFDESLLDEPFPEDDQPGPTPTP
jgi:hypothetical protein